MSGLTRDGPKASRDTKFSGVNGNRQRNIRFPVQLTTRRIGNLTRLFHTPLYICESRTYSLGDIRIMATVLVALVREKYERI